MQEEKISLEVLTDRKRPDLSCSENVHPSPGRVRLRSQVGCEEHLQSGLLSSVTTVLLSSQSPLYQMPPHLGNIFYPQLMSEVEEKNDQAYSF